MRIEGRLRNDGAYEIYQGDRVLQVIPADQLDGHKKLAKAIQRNGWEKP